MALAKTVPKKKYGSKKRISTEAITHSYKYRQIAMTPINKQIAFIPEKESRSVDVGKRPELTTEEVLLLEAT